MNTVLLSSVAEINPPGPRGDALDPETNLDFLPMAAVCEDGRMEVVEQRPYGELMKGYTAFRQSDVLVAKITPCFENNKIALATVATDYAFGSTEFHVIRCSPGELHPPYLTHFLRQDRIRQAGERRMTGSAGQRRVPKDFLAKLDVPLPPLAEQERIAAILDQADSLRRLRQRAIDRLNSLGQAIFYEMFVHNSASAKWPVVTVADLAQTTRTGPFGSQLLHSEFVDEGVAVLGIDNAVSNEFCWAKPRHITPEKYRDLRRYTVYPGDVLITLMGTCGRCAVVPDDISLAINTKHLCCITLRQDVILPAYLHSAFLQHPSVLKQLGAETKGAVMPGLNMNIIRGLEIVLPPINIQRNYVERKFLISAQVRKMVEHRDRLDSMFASTQHRAFRGEL